MAVHNITGAEGEELAKNFLEEKGFAIEEKNFRYKRAEIDLIALKDNLLIFVEVKTRSNSRYGEPEAFVNHKKAALILEAAEHYVLEKNWLSDIRFDIISVVVKPIVKIHHFEDAFY